MMNRHASPHELKRMNHTINLTHSMEYKRKKNSIHLK